MSKKITRRQAITRALIALGVTSLGSPGSALARGAPTTATPTFRPNILLLIADGWSWQGAEAIDRLGLRMPTLARLQHDGVSFENAFVASSEASCAYLKVLEKRDYVIGRGGSESAAGTLAALIADRAAGKPFFFQFESDGATRLPIDVDPASVNVPPYLPDTPAVRGDIAAYRSALERFDRDAGSLIELLDGRGELADTLVIMTGAGGWSFPRGKETLYEAGTHVPLVAMYKRIVPGGRTSKTLVSSEDLFPTFLDVAGKADSSKRSLMPLMTSSGDHARPFLLMRREQPMDAYSSRAFRTPQYLYIRNVFPNHRPAGAPARQAVTPQQIDRETDAAFAGISPSPTKTAMIVGRGDPAMDRLLNLATEKRPAAELYDVAADPFQLNNLAADPTVRAVVMRLDRQLMVELKRNGDTRHLSLRALT